MRPYSNETSGASVQTARENGGEMLARFTLEDHACGASRLPKRPKTTVLQSRLKLLTGIKVSFLSLLLLAIDKRKLVQ